MTMERQPELVVIAADGTETVIAGDSQFSLGQKNLLVKVETGSDLNCWHLDRFACAIIRQGKRGEAKTENSCEAVLRLDQGRTERRLSLSFQQFKKNSAENYILFEGARERVIINLDFLQWYTVEKDEKK